MRDRWQTSLQFRLVAFFLLLSWPSVAVVGYLAYLRARTALTLSVLNSSTREPAPGPTRYATGSMISIRACGNSRRFRRSVSVRGPRQRRPRLTPRSAAKTPPVHGIVRQHRGQVEVASEVGRGTSVCVYLPTQVIADDRVAPHAAERAVAGAAKPCCSRRTIRP